MKSMAVRSLSPRLENMLSTMGRNLNMARRRRRITLSELSERALVSVPTLRAIEAGSPSVSIGVVLKVFSVIGLEEGFVSIAAPENDKAGMQEEARRLPKRVVPPRDLELEFTKGKRQ